MAPEMSEAARDAAAVVGGTALVFLIVLTAFQIVDDAGTEAAPAADTTAVGWPVDASVQPFRDPDLGLEMAVPSTWERVFVQGTGEEPETDSDGPDAEAVFREPTAGGELRLEAWDAADRASFGLWLGVVAGNMVPVGADPLPNAIVSGTPAHILWRPGEDGSATYAAFLERDGRYYRLSYRTGAGGDPSPFRAALASVAWQSAHPVGSASPMPISLPPLPAPDEG